MANKMKVHVQGEALGMQAIINAGAHTITIDEPTKMGGTDTGADPLQTLLGALAGCENVVANLVAKEINFDLQGITFDIQGELDPRGFMGQEGVRPYFEKVVINAKVKTSESQERITELQTITDQRCPVYTTLKAANVMLDSSWTKA
ncbi:OsmC family protein [Halalkalibacter nanhaiisediminis]|uniref:Putative OsmC-like protein n=1 Tax=Halalkalibacter nanhaiisediminis TaxID=688079 RepID=A0A562QMZ9_9BACI|nr:OsmC family protein [Halalkalibacter nanhaiisediminis]TWI58132.1 putative OsmC-like protein [Halalkalibacter nanhaiisediminis]